MYQGDVKGGSRAEAVSRCFGFVPESSWRHRSGPVGASGSLCPERVHPAGSEEGQGLRFLPRREQSLPCWCECQGAALSLCLRGELGWPGILLQQMGWHWRAPGWAGGPDFGQRPGVILRQPFGRRAAPGETGWTRVLLLVPGEKRPCYQEGALF